MIWYDLLEESQCQEQQFDSPLWKVSTLGGQTQNCWSIAAPHSFFSSHKYPSYITSIHQSVLFNPVPLSAYT